MPLGFMFDCNNVRPQDRHTNGRMLFNLFIWYPVYTWRTTFGSICLPASSGVSSVLKSKINGGALQEMQMHNSLAESFLKFHTYLALILS